MNTIELAKQLINIKSVTPDDAGCQKILINALKKLGFEITEYNKNGVSNFWATHGKGHPIFCFAGHTDVVPAGDEKSWKFPPFKATEHDGNLYGRGSADMKSSIAAMVCAVETFLKTNPKHSGTIAFLITSDEEGANNEFGTKYVIENLKTKIDYCLVGEATSADKFGDTIKIGRRGSVHGELIIHGKQGHIAYPEKTKNPIHLAMEIIDAIVQTKWDKGNEHFQPTSLQFYDIKSGLGVGNVVPPNLTAKFNFRYCPESTPENLAAKINETIKKFNTECELKMHQASHGYYSKPANLTNACAAAIEKYCNVKPHCSTTGGTSDGRFIATICPEVIEFGPINESIHQVNEHVKISDLEILNQLYLHILNTLLQCC